MLTCQQSRTGRQLKVRAALAGRDLDTLLAELQEQALTAGPAERSRAFVTLVHRGWRRRVNASRNIDLSVSRRPDVVTTWPVGMSPSLFRHFTSSDARLPAPHLRILCALSRSLTRTCPRSSSSVQCRQPLTPPSRGDSNPYLEGGKLLGDLTESRKRAHCPLVLRWSRPEDVLRVVDRHPGTTSE